MKSNNGLAGSLVVLIQYRDKSYTAYAISSIRMLSTASSARAEYLNILIAARFLIGRGVEIALVIFTKSNVFSTVIVHCNSN